MKLKYLGLAVLVVAAIPTQGFIVFSFLGQGSFFGRSGLVCTVSPIFVELVVLVVAAMHFERIHSSSVANPHSLIGQALRKETTDPRQPSVRAAWDGGWEQPADAAEKMRADR
jgi:hypothetical protein